MVVQINKHQPKYSSIPHHQFYFNPDTFFLIKYTSLSTTLNEIKTKAGNTFLSQNSKPKRKTFTSKMKNTRKKSEKFSFSYSFSRNHNFIDLSFTKCKESGKKHQREISSPLHIRIRAINHMNIIFFLCTRKTPKKIHFKQFFIQPVCSLWNLKIEVVCFFFVDVSERIPFFSLSIWAADLHFYGCFYFSILNGLKAFCVYWAIKSSIIAEFCFSSENDFFYFARKWMSSRISFVNWIKVQ